MASESSEKKCPACDTQIQKAWKACPHCGAAILGDEIAGPGGDEYLRKIAREEILKSSSQGKSTVAPVGPRSAIEEFLED